MRALISTLALGAALVTSNPAAAEAPAQKARAECLSLIAPHGAGILEKIQGYRTSPATSWQVAAAAYVSSSSTQAELGRIGCVDHLSASDFMQVAGVSDPAPQPVPAPVPSAAPSAAPTAPAAEATNPAPVRVETRTVVRQVADPALAKQQKRLEAEQKDLLAEIKTLQEKPGPLTPEELKKLKLLLDAEKGIDAKLKELGERLDAHDESISALGIGFALLALAVFALAFAVISLWFRRPSNRPDENDVP